MFELLAFLEAIESYAGDCHYHFEQYGQHLLADRIRKDIDEYSDEIKEVCYLGNNELTPYSRDILTAALAKIPAISPVEGMNFQNLEELLQECLLHIQRMDTQEMPVGSKNLIEDIAQKLQQLYGLVWKLKKA